MSGLCQEIFMLLRDNQVVEADMELNDFVNLMYKPGKQRLEILMWMILKLSNRHGSYLQLSENAHLDLASKLSEMQFLESSDKIAFSKGELPVKKQEEILNKIFKSVLSVQFLQSNRKQGLSFKENFKIQGFCLNFPRVKKTKYVKGRKPIKSFDFNAARNNLKDAKQSVQRLANFMKEMQLTVEPQPEPEDSYKKNDIPEMGSLKSDFCESLSGLEFLSSYSCGVSELFEEELNTAVEQLYSVSQAFNQVPKTFPRDDLGITRKLELRKPIEDRNDIRKTSIISHLNELYSSTAVQQ